MAIFLGPRYEYALLAGLVGPFILAFWLALGFDPNKTARQQLGPPLKFALLLLGIAFLGGFYEGNCEPGYGYGLLLLGPGVGSISLAICVNAVLRLSASGPVAHVGRRLGVALSIPAVVLGYGLWRLYEDPAVFAYSEFSGYFAGPLYDLVDYRLPTLLTYRIGSILLMLSLVALEARQLGAWRRTLASAGFTAYWGYRSLLGPWLGHELTEASLARVLSATLVADPCVVRYDPNRTTKSSAALVLRQCTADVRGVANYFDVPQPTRATVSLFASVEEKGRITGAGRTYVAKPWRHEVHLHEAGFPHPTLRHELAHVVSAGFGSGPFQASGPLGGWIPDPGRIEGFAVAAAPLWESDGTLEDWASAAQRLGKLPPLTQLFQLGFYGSSAVSAYGAAGAFVAFLREAYGAATLRAWYGGKSLESATGHTLGELEAQFLARLGAVSVPELVRNSAEQRFSALAVGERRCPHAVDRALGAAAELCALDATLARKKVESAVGLDPGEADSYLWLSGCFLEAGDIQVGRTLLDSYQAGPLWSQRERELRLADLAFFSGDLLTAEQGYRKLLARQSNSSEQRALALRIWALSNDATEGERDLVRLGVLTGVSEAERTGALLLHHELGARRFVIPYLLGRKLLEQRAFRAAAKLFEEAQMSPAPHASLTVEAKRLWLIASCAMSDQARVTRAMEALQAEPLTPNQRADAQHILELCK